MSNAKKCLTVWLWNLKKKKISAKKLTVFDFHRVKCKNLSHCVTVFDFLFDFHHVKCKLSHCTYDCESHRVNVKLFSQPTRNLHPSVCNNKSWIWMICSILLSIFDAVYYYQWKLSPKVIIYFQIWPFGIFKVGAIGIFPNWWTKVLIRNNKTCPSVTFSSVSVE